MEAEVAVLGLGGEVADGARVVVADAEVEAEAVADGEGEDVGADGELVAGGDDVEDGVRVLGAKGGEALRVVGGLDCWWCAWYCLSAPGPSDVAVLALAAVAAGTAGVVAAV